MDDFQRQLISQIINLNAQHSTLHFDKTEFERLPHKETELQVNDEILKEVLQNLENHLHNRVEIDTEFSFIAAQFKNNCMKTSSLSPAIIEAALTIIIDQMKDENLTNNKQYTTLKQSPFLLSYKDDHHWYKKGVRIFDMKRKSQQSNQQ